MADQEAPAVVPATDPKAAAAPAADAPKPEAPPVRDNTLLWTAGVVLGAVVCIVGAILLVKKIRKINADWA